LRASKWETSVAATAMQIKQLLKEGSHELPETGFYHLLQQKILSYFKTKKPANNSEPFY
jgi:hypothetical protein